MNLKIINQKNAINPAKFSGVLVSELFGLENFSSDENLPFNNCPS